MIKFIVRIFFLFFVCGSLYGQTLEGLRNERETILKEISDIHRLIEKKRESRQDYLRELSLLGREIKNRQKLIDNFKNEISQLDNQIEVNQMLINDLEDDINELKKEYSRLIQYAFKQKGRLNQLMFLFSAESFSNLYNKYRLFKEYSGYRKRQGEKLIESQNKVKGLLSEIRVQKEEKQTVLNEIEGELNRLELNKRRQTTLVQNLQKEQRWLQQSLKKKEQAANELERKIRALIEAEKSSNISHEESIGFQDVKGKLAWPVEDGVIVNAFGEHAHPVLKNVTIKNNGVDIQLINHDKVYCVHSGTVSTVVAIPGLNKTVIIRHGKYLTVYGNLVEVFVKKGDLVSAGQNLGKIFKGNGNNEKILHFEIWEESKKLDPEHWLIR
ncbi:murein hydrolase activator EnvC family protein [Thermophagus sp. OGC60D27]|uniref:murein hydrolase activator EnvC family protein n=1 Tax=Thermophagus sp. OGC60D27 TaxID=3458415 RepID=UPI00403766CA